VSSSCQQRIFPAVKSKSSYLVTVEGLESKPSTVTPTVPVLHRF